MIAYLVFDILKITLKYTDNLEQVANDHATVLARQLCISVFACVHCSVCWLLSLIFATGKISIWNQ